MKKKMEILKWKRFWDNVIMISTTNVKKECLPLTEQSETDDALQVPNEQTGSKSGDCCLTFSIFGWLVGGCGILIQFREYDAGDFEFLIRFFYFAVFALPAAGIHLASFIAGLCYIFSSKEVLSSRGAVGFTLSVLYLILAAILFLPGFFS